MDVLAKDKGLKERCVRPRYRKEGESVGCWGIEHDAETIWDGRRADRDGPAACWLMEYARGGVGDALTATVRGFRQLQRACPTPACSLARSRGWLLQDHDCGRGARSCPSSDLSHTLMQLTLVSSPSPTPTAHTDARTQPLTPTRVAIKKIAEALNHPLDAKLVLREIRIARLLGCHPNILGIRTLVKPPSVDRMDTIYIVSDYMDIDLYRTFMFASSHIPTRHNRAVTHTPIPPHARTCVTMCLLYDTLFHTQRACLVSNVCAHTHTLRSFHSSFHSASLV